MYTLYFAPSVTSPVTSTVNHSCVFTFAILTIRYQIVVVPMFELPRLYFYAAQCFPSIAILSGAAAFTDISDMLQALSATTNANIERRAG